LFGGLQPFKILGLLIRLRKLLATRVPAALETRHHWIAAPDLLRRMSCVRSR
jgi:hypothetical protein